MPEGNRKTPTTIKIKYKYFLENSVEGYNIYTLYVDGDSYLELPLDANVRLPTEKTVPFKGMVVTLKNNPKNFFLQNNGMSVIASKVTLNKNKKEATFVFNPHTGIVNGGHTQLAILTVQKEKSISDAIVKMDIIEHDFDLKELAIIAASRNTASNVKDYSTAEKRGDFVKIKEKMDEEIEKHIIWYENRDVPNGQGLPADDLIARLNLFNVISHLSNYCDKNEQPIKSAR